VTFDIYYFLYGTVSSISCYLFTFFCWMCQLCPLAKWSGLRFQSSGSWVHVPPSGPVCTYWLIPIPKGQGSGIGLCASTWCAMYALPCMLIVYSHPIPAVRGSVMGHWAPSSMLHAHKIINWVLIVLIVSFQSSFFTWPLRLFPGQMSGVTSWLTFHIFRNSLQFPWQWFFHFV